MAKKIGLFIAGAAALMVLLFHLGPLVGLAITLAILYYAFKKYLKAPSTFGKIAWALIGCAALVISVSNVPALIALVAAYVLYVVYKKWNSAKGERTVPETDDPFVNFEKQWAELQKHH
ncbi:MULTISPECIES: permease [Geobacillus]|jgi:lia operon protein LiaI|uniref:lmo0954 family membrane protein n=1 Tax=Geobacillus TaxID=129337 RepID=UPI00017E6F64|nr:MULTISPECIES: permease [Geobacillus]KQB94555.1 permease [Geobacillus sp. PA-3]MEC5189120.1 lia operon protein LiaI [Geobacillus thermodenitrificans]MED3906547.1 flagellar basal body rod protein [Geobacillus thermodenitrificans]MED4916550.1 flagellar basal body rod protein [Geobacillus thermodenitrificans]NNU87798.1 flagellar basal body rod protein [Geobacillus sp. MR]